MPIGQLLILLTLAWLCYLLVKVIQKPSEWPALVQILPLLAFINYARCFDLSEACWPYAFVVAGVVALVVVVLLASLNIFMDRFLLGVNIFFIAGGIAFAANLNWYLSLLGHYKGAFFLGSIALVGLCSLLFTKAGFIGVKNDNQKNKSSSWILFGATVIAVFWAIIFANKSLLWSTVLPFIVLRIIRSHLLTME